MNTRVLVLFFVLGSVAAANAQTPPAAATPAPEPDYPVIRVGVLSYVQYDAELENRQGFNAFALTPRHTYVQHQTGGNTDKVDAQTYVNKYKSVQARLTLRPLAGRGLANGFRLSGFYNAGWYAANRPRNLGIVMGSFEHSHVAAT